MTIFASALIRMQTSLRGLGVLFIAMLAVLLTHTLPVSAAEKAPDPVVASGKGFEIHMSDVERARRQLPPQAQQYPMERVFSFLVNNLVNTKLVATEARKEGLDKTESVKSLMMRFEEQTLHQQYLSKRVSDAVTDERLKDSYQTYLKDNSVGQEIRARHILVKTEGEAKDVIKRLGRGEDFATLAKSLSTGPSGKNGGDLGYFTAERMVPAFSAAAFATKPGGYTDKPVQTQFGWHIIKVEDKRSKPPKSFAEVSGELREKISRDVAEAIVAELRKAADVKTFGPDGK